MLQHNNGKTQLRLKINLKLHQLTSLLFLALVCLLTFGQTSPYPYSLRPYLTFVLLFSFVALVVKEILYKRQLLPRFFWLMDLLDVATASFIYYLGFFSVNYLIVLYFFLIFLSVREFIPGETHYLTLLSLIGFGINVALLWPNYRILAPIYGMDPVFYGFIVGSAFFSLVFVGVFAYFYAKSDFRLSRHLEQMLAEKEAALKETYLTHANLEEKYAFSYTLTLIQQFLLEEMDETNLLTRITDIIQGIVGSYSCAIFSLDKDNTIRLAAYSGKQLPPDLPEFVQRKDSLVALTIKSQAIHNEKDASFAERNFWAEHNIHSLITIPLSTKNNKLGVILVTSAQTFSFDQEQQEQLMIIANQISLALENTRLHKETKLMAWHDSLTGLYNRNYLNIFLSIVEDSTSNRLGCLIFDLDHFKVVNDTYGHTTGDMVLKKLATILSKHTSPGRIAVRYGGEEFIMLDLNSSMEELYNLGEQIRKEVAAYKFWTATGEEFSITISCGIALDDTGFDKVFAKADTALYQAKNQGRNQVVIYGSRAMETSVN
ncbi:MAG TPA: diguanylate cyclase [Firmicutes bacterium]|uniref:Diguanylate cyclase n=1 Tax=Capillibacterium thermochitinicola TaxID=2699427 RepID=A0A8J6LRE0_9FIRM|nr:diguanylate cyclase [Capillibacterium thermochitinicola]MBA2131987.1 diguanylate cyclase [Capillibacterium thermochitinicola]HHW12581.1 diguanylate cyclase [Bacillota bacterium]